MSSSRWPRQDPEKQHRRGSRVGPGEGARCDTWELTAYPSRLPGRVGSAQALICWSVVNRGRWEVGTLDVSRTIPQGLCLEWVVWGAQSPG